MARKLKPQKVGDFTDAQAGVAVSLMLDRNDFLFFAELSGQRIEAATMSELQGALRSAVSESSALDWHDVVLIEVNQQAKHYPNAPSIKLTAWRILIARDAKGNLLKVSGSAEPAQRLRLSEKFYWGASGDDPLICSPAVVRSSDSYCQRMLAVFEYSDETWAAVMRLQAALGNLGEQLVALLVGPVDALRILSDSPRLPALFADPPPVKAGEEEEESREFSPTQARAIKFFSGEAQEEQHV